MPSINFTARKLDSLKAPDAGQVDYWDSSLPGFGLRVAPSGRKSFCVMYRLGKVKRRMTLGVYPTLSLADAREQAEDAIRAASKGRDPAHEQKSERAAETFAEMVADYLERHAKPRKRSWKKDEAILNRYFMPTLKHRKARNIARRDIIRILDAIVEKGAPIQANRALEIARKVFNWAISRDLVEANPCQAVAKPSAERTRERALSDAEVKAFWAGLEGAAMREGTKLALQLMLITAQRKGEVAGAALDEFDEKEKLWAIPAARSKNKRDHIVPLSALALSIVKTAKAEAAKLKREEPSPWLFPSPQGRGEKPITGPAIDHALRNNLADHQAERLKGKRAPMALKDVRPHDLRRTASTGMRRLGVSQFIVGRVLNHTDRTVTGKHYDRYDALKEKRNALKLWAAHLEALTSGAAQPSNVIPLARPA